MIAATAHRERVAVLVVFFVNGAVLANWAPRIPTIQDDLSLTTATLGIALTGMGIGGLLATAVSGLAVERFGSRVVVMAAAAVMSLMLVLPALSWSWWSLLIALAVLGGADAVMDVAMNSQGVVVERHYGRSLMSGFHAAWSLGAVVGGLMGTAAAALVVPVAAHFALVGIVLTVVALVAGRHLVRDETADTPPTTTAGPHRRVPRPTIALVLVSLLVLFAAFVEDVPQSWSAVYLSTELSAGPGLAGLAFVAFSAAMMVGRLIADRLIDRVGSTAVLVGGGVTVAAAFAVGLSAPSPIGMIAAFAVVGLGAAPVFPIAFSVAGRLPGVASGHGIASVALVSRVGFLVAPLLVGTVADIASFRIALLTVVVAGVAIALLAVRVRRDITAPSTEARPPRPHAVQRGSTGRHHPTGGPS